MDPELLMKRLDRRLSPSREIAPCSVNRSALTAEIREYVYHFRFHFQNCCGKIYYINSLPKRKRFLFQLSTFDNLTTISRKGSFRHMTFVKFFLGPAENRQPEALAQLFNYRLRQDGNFVGVYPFKKVGGRLEGSKQTPP